MIYKIGIIELCPVFDVHEKFGLRDIELTEEEYKEYEEIYSKWEVWQDKLKEAYGWFND